MAKNVNNKIKFEVEFTSNLEKTINEWNSKIKAMNLKVPINAEIDDITKGFEKVFSKLRAEFSKPMGEKQGIKIFEDAQNQINNLGTRIKNLGSKINGVFQSSGNQKLIEDYKAIENRIKQSASALKKYNDLLKERERITNELNSGRIRISPDTQLQTVQSLINQWENKPKSKVSGNAAGLIATAGESNKTNTIPLMREYVANEQKIRALENEGIILSEKKKEKLVEQSKELQKQIVYEDDKNKATKALKQVKNEVSIQSIPSLFESGSKNALDEGVIKAEKLGNAFKVIQSTLASFGVPVSLVAMGRELVKLTEYSWNFYQSLDSALNEIYVVSNLSMESVKGLTNDFIAMAKNTGMAVDDISKSAVLFYQQGLGTNEVLTMTEVTSQFAKVAGIDATDAADKLTAAVNGYCLSANDASIVADKFNKVAAASAADINELSTAFSKAAAQANQAGVSMDNYLAYIATMEEATRESPANLGTSLKTIFARMQKIQTGENTEDSVDINQVETALKSVNVSLRDTEGQLRDLEDVFAELGPKWNSLDRNTQAYIGTMVAGTRLRLVGAFGGLL